MHEEPRREEIEEIEEIEAPRRVIEAPPREIGTGGNNGGEPVGYPRPLYSSTIHHVIASGDLPRMKQIAQQAEKVLSEIGDLSAALDSLRIEILKIEVGRR